MSTQLDIGDRMTIGELAKRASIPASKIRYYEKVGVLPRSQRTDSNYRVYDVSAVARLQLLSRGKLLGLTLSELGVLVQAADEGCCDTTGPLLLDLVRHKRDQIDQRIKELQALRTTLTEALSGQVNETALGVLGADSDCGRDACIPGTGSKVTRQPLRLGDRRSLLSRCVNGIRRRSSVH